MSEHMPQQAPPTPAVQHLPTILRRVQTGDIVVPAFQREVVWKEKQVVELLESVYSGFPVGSLLLWKVEDRTIDPGRLMGPPFPKVEIKKPTHYVLDGQQRLATLFGCLYATPDRQPIFDMSFDLVSRKFARTSDASIAAEDGSTPEWIRLSELFSPKDFLSAQQRISARSDADVLLERAVALHATFQEYMLPLVTIENRNVADVVKIFERINNTGTKLDAVDFLRAVTWSIGFDLNRQIESVRSQIEMIGFPLESETIAKLIAIVLGKAPVLEDMLTLQEMPVEKLRAGTAEAIECSKLAVEFFKEYFKIFSYDYIPYEAQFLLVAKMFHRDRNPPQWAVGAVSRWLWSVGFSEGLQGKADHQIARILDDVDSLLGGQRRALKFPLQLNKDTLLSRRLYRFKALSATMVALFVRRKPRSLITGAVIDPEDYMSSFDPERCWPLASREAVSSALGRDLPAKILANVVILGPGDRHKMAVASGAAIIRSLRERKGARAPAVLASQFITEEAAEALLAGKVKQFLDLRTATLMEEISTVAT